MRQLSVIVSRFQNILRKRMHLHDRIGASHGIARQSTGIHHNRRIHHRAGKARQLGRQYQHIGLTGHTPLLHILIIHVHARRRRKQRIVTPLLQQVLRNSGQTRSRRQIGVGLVGTHVKQYIGRGDANDDFVDLQRARVGDTMDSSARQFRRRFDVVQSHGADRDTIRSRNIGLQSSGNAVLKRRLRVTGGKMLVVMRYAMNTKQKHRRLTPTRPSHLPNSAQAQIASSTWDVRSTILPTAAKSCAQRMFRTGQ